MIEVIDGILWQWDKNRRVKLTPPEGKEITDIQFYPGVGGQGYRGVFADGGALIPDECLQSQSGLVVYAVYADRTIEKAVFGIKKRPKPPNYSTDDTKTYIMVDETNIGQTLVKNDGVYGWSDEVVIPKEYGRITYDQDKNITIS